jgi:hypothetical protein
MLSVELSPVPVPSEPLDVTETAPARSHTHDVAHRHAGVCRRVRDSAYEPDRTGVGVAVAVADPLRVAEEGGSDPVSASSGDTTLPTPPTDTNAAAVALEEPLPVRPTARLPSGFSGRYTPPGGEMSLRSVLRYWNCTVVSVAPTVVSSLSFVDTTIFTVGRRNTGTLESWLLMAQVARQQQ